MISNLEEKNMVYCSKCGNKNDDDAVFCSKCGSALNNENIERTFDKRIKKTVNKIEEKAENLGKSMDQAGKRFEKRIENTFEDFQKWFDNKFKLVGPLIWSFLGLILLRIFIWLFDISRDEINLLGEISDFLFKYILIFFGLMLLNTYNSYFNRIYKKQYSWIFPAVSTISFTVTIWIISEFLIILNKNLNIPVLTNIANFINNYIIFIFVLALLVSYSFTKLIIPYVKEINQK
jgi:hypothetical protein